jgi:uncharacterized protein GlcG (DUF336 family)
VVDCGGNLLAFGRMDDAPLSNLPGSIMIPGDLPIIIDDEIVGGTGASGGMAEEDIACSQAGLDVLFD